MQFSNRTTLPLDCEAQPSEADPEMLKLVFISQERLDGTEVRLRNFYQALDTLGEETERVSSTYTSAIHRISLVDPRGPSLETPFFTPELCFAEACHQNMRAFDLALIFRIILPSKISFSNSRGWGRRNRHEETQRTSFWKEEESSTEGSKEQKQKSGS
jgi:hypothetical protein